MAAKKPVEDTDSVDELEKIDNQIDYYANVDYDSLVGGEVDTIPGWAVVGPEEPVTKKMLVGSPFAIVGMVFRPSNVSAAQYVSLLAISKQYGTLCINDGSTGIRSQALEYCVKKGIAKYKGPGSDAKFIERVNNYEWNVPATVSFVGELGSGEEEIRVDVPFRIPLNCPRGLRKSDYDFDNEETGKKGSATTYYLG